MTDDTPQNQREPSLGGRQVRPTNHEPALSLEHLLPGLRDSFSSDDRSTRAQTISDLTTNAESAAPVLIRLLAEAQDTRTRQRCAAVLGQMGDHRAGPPLIEALSDPDPSLRKVAIWSLGQLHYPAATAPILRLLDRETDHRVIKMAIQSIGEIGDISAWQTLILLSKHSEESIAANAVATARALGRRCSLDQYVELLHSEDEKLRQWAEQWAYCSEPMHARHLPILERLLNYKHNAEVRHRTVHWLSRIDDQRARNHFLELLTHSDERTRYAAFQAVKATRMREALSILIRQHAFEGNKNGSAVIEAIGVIDDPRVVPFLLDVIESSDHNWSAEQALRDRNEPGIGQLLLQRLSRAQPEARCRILDALGSYNSPEVISVLLEIIRHSDDQDERRVAVESLRPDEFPEIIPDLVDILYNEGNTTIANRAIWTLCRTFDAQVERILRDFMATTDCEDLRADALNALLTHDVPDARELLLTQLNHISDEDALRTIVHHLHILGEDTEFGVIRSLLSTASSAALRATIVDEMTHVMHPDAIPLIIQILKTDPSSWVRCTAISTLYFEAWRNDQVVEAIVEALNDSAISDHPWAEGHRVCDSAANCLQRLDRPDVVAALQAWRARNGLEI